MPHRAAFTALTAAAVVLALSMAALAVATPADMNTWTPHNTPYGGGYVVEDGVWDVSLDGLKATQMVNGKPTFFASPGNADGNRLTTTFVAPENYDNDFFGIALGFTTDPSDPATDYLLVDWKQGYQDIDWLDGVGEVAGNPGLAVSRVSGVATLGEMWGHVDSVGNPAGGVAELERGATLGAVGWVDGESYDFVFEYTTTSLDVWVNGSHEISIAGDFPSGPMAMYDFSQPGVAVSAVTFESLNGPPVVDGSGAADVVEFEGDTGSTSGSFTDPDGDVLSLSCSGECDGLVDEGGGAWSWSQDLPEGPHGFSVTVTASDGEYEVDDSFDVTVVNLAPVITATSSVPSMLADDTTLNAWAGFTDAGVEDTHTATFYWGDGTSSPATVDEVPGSGTAGAGHEYAGPGAYTITVTVWDDDGAWDTAVLGEVFVFDPDDFVTGGGWVRSPSGALASDQAHTGRATFGFIVRYDRSGAVRGSLELQVHRELNVHATGFDTLTIFDGVAHFSGDATVNGETGFSFEAVATDERHATSDVDLFWIEITGPGGLVYGGPGYPSAGLATTGLGIQVHDRQ